MTYMDYFRQISMIPRGSYHNEKISDYLVEFAKEHGLFYYRDETLNVLIRKDATKGYEDLPGIIIQGHMDMVCVKDKDSEHDFLTQGIELVEDEESIWANGTSLGGDNGIAIAYGLAILSSNEYEHPQFELLVTTDEEVGMYGAKAFDTKILKGKWLLNVDSEEEDTIINGCAGGMTVKVEIPMERVSKEGEEFFEIEVGGLSGGHSGTEIDKNRQNASIVLGRILACLKEKYDFSLYSLKGGEKDNVITSKASAVISYDISRQSADKPCKAPSDVPKLEYDPDDVMIDEKSIMIMKFIKCAKDIMEELTEELRAAEPDIKLSIKRIYLSDITKTEDFEGQYQSAISGISLDKVINYIMLSPNGVQTMKAELFGVVESSLNLGILNLEENKLICGHSLRSMSPSYKRYMGEKIKKMAELLGGEYSESGAYPEWKYKEISEFRDRAVVAYRKIFNREPKQLIIHAGLECGILYEKEPELEIISVGPDIYDAHSTREKMSKASAERVFNFIIEVLKCGKIK